MTDDKIPLPQLQGHHCFGCGTANPHGLKLRFYRQGRTVRSDVTLSHDYEGWQNMAHGGIISTVLDEIMAWTVIAFKRVFFVTGRMEVVYLHPVPIEEPLTARGEISPEQYDRGCIASGAIVDGRDRILATARAEIVFLPEERLDKLPQNLKDDMHALYAEMEKLCAD